MNQFWLIRETEIDHYHPLRYGDTIQVKTYVADFRRVRSRRAYEFYDTKTEKLASRAFTDWVFLNRDTLRPASIPESMMNAFFPEGPPEQAPPRPRFPDPPSPPSGVFHLTHRAAWSDLDPAGHVNNAVYLAYANDCATEADAAHGWPHERMLAAGFVTTPLKQHIEYRQQAMLGQELELCTWLSDIDQTTAVRHTTVTRIADDTLLAQARTLWEAVDPHTRQPVPIPGEYLSDLSPNTSEEPLR